MDPDFGENFLLPAAGILFLPWTTIVYVLVFPEGITGLDIALLIIAVIADMGSYLGGGLGSGGDGPPASRTASRPRRPCRP